MSLFAKIFGDANERYLKKIKPVIEAINKLEPRFENFSDRELKEKTSEFRAELEKIKSVKDLKNYLDRILPSAFALVREAAKRTLNQRHFDVQLMGGVAMHQGKVAEMKTGEGKTLAATLPAYLNALPGQGVHIITVNDYLARRDTVWMGQIYHFLGLSVGCLNHEQSFLYDPNYKKPDKSRDEIRDELGGFLVVQDFLRPCSRKEAYLADITYGTNNEFGFDYLRDNLVYQPTAIVQRELNFAILDEIDFILIDEARTPLIISAPDAKASEMYRQFAKIVPLLKAEIDYEVDEERKVVTLTEKGIKKVEEILGIDNVYAQEGIDYLYHLEQALRAQAINPSDGKPLFAKDRDYIVKNGKVIIVDEFTGRLMPGRRWSGGLHQAIEAKEGVEVLPESRTLATITFQNYFRLYQKLAGMTGTAVTSAEEFDKVYNLDVICIPTNKPMIRKDFPDRVYRTEKGKFQAIVEEVKKRHQRGQPILIGTRSIEKNEFLAKLLRREGIACQVLNAKHHEKEAQIIAQAGKLRAVTVATNMAGRGVDILLGGYPPAKIKNQKSNLKNEDKEDGLIKSQISNFKDGEDELYKKHQTKIKNQKSNLKNEDKEGELYKKWREEQEKVKALGGLHVIGTERHEARRIDDQLRGRAGRQGDVGSSQFFLSLEDELLRVFGGERIERIKTLMEKTNFPEDQPIESKLLSKTIEAAQAKIEGFHFDIRKNLLDYDDVVNKHREVFYRKRREILMASVDSFRERLLRIWQEQGFSEQEFSRKEKDLGRENFLKTARFLALRILDFYWMHHLEDMQWLKESVRLKAFGNLNPLVVYKTDGYQIFQEMILESEKTLIKTLTKLETLKKNQIPQRTVRPAERRGGQKKPGRNDPCPCGATYPDGRPKKYKHCHGRVV